LSLNAAKPLHGGVRCKIAVNLSPAAAPAAVLVPDQ
jgi:hypothetical protein